MADIRITQAHALPLIQARAAAQSVADQIVAEYDLAACWHGDMLQFQRSGVSGTLRLSEEAAHLEITLGFLLKGFASAIEAKVAAKMQKVFAGAA
jgi:putative polyhydroxyalkanoate system protein